MKSHFEMNLFIPFPYFETEHIKIYLQSTLKTIDLGQSQNDYLHRSRGSSSFLNITVGKHNVSSAYQMRHTMCPSQLGIQALI